MATAAFHIRIGTGRDGVSREKATSIGRRRARHVACCGGIARVATRRKPSAVLAARAWTCCGLAENGWWHNVLPLGVDTPVRERCASEEDIVVAGPACSPREPRFPHVVGVARDTVLFHRYISRQRLEGRSADGHHREAHVQVRNEGWVYPLAVFRVCYAGRQLVLATMNGVCLPDEGVWAVPRVVVAGLARSDGKRVERVVAIG